MFYFVFVFYETMIFDINFSIKIVVFNNKIDKFIEIVKSKRKRQKKF